MSMLRSTRRTASLAIILSMAPISAQEPVTSERQGHQEKHHDIFEGMDKNGRIPKSQRPEDLPHPDRWRYVPEGRLMDGNIFDRFLVSSFISPVFFREADVGFGGGFVVTDLDFRNRRRKEFANMIFTYTTEGQQNYSLNWRRWRNHMELPGGGIIQDERSFYHLNAGYSRTLTRRFYGLGSDTTALDETSYTDQVAHAEFYDQLTIPTPAADMILRLGLEAEHHALSAGRVEGVPTSDQSHPGLFDEGDGQSLLWAIAGFQYNTRDSLHNPYTGWNVGASVRAAPLQTDGDIGALWNLNASKVFALPPVFHDGGDDKEENPPTDTIAFGATILTTTGDLPFYSLPSLGGSRTLRGYVPNRFTDRSSWHASAEYRLWVLPRGMTMTKRLRVERVGLALFYELGSVADRAEDLQDSRVRTSYGLGMRVSLERTAVFRFDLGFSKEDTNFSIAYGLTF